MNEDHKNLERYADWLDTKFRIPGTRVTFGLDFIIGLFPIVGDIFTLGLSGVLVIIMVRKGASGKALSLMILNTALDSTLGSIPIFGDVFDLFFKANRRNLNLFQDHFQEGKHQGSAWTVVLILIAIIILLMLGLIYLIYKIFAWSWFLISEYLV